MTDSMRAEDTADKPTSRAPVVLLGVDASEIDLIDQLVKAGKMPRLAALRETSFCGRLQTEPSQFLSIVWTTAFTSKGLGEHGWYFNKQWDHERQQIQASDTDWLPRTPFWEELDDDYKLALFDIPYAINSPDRENTLSIAGWQCHDDFGKAIKPDKLASYLVDKFGKSAMGAEIFGPQSASTLLALREEALDTAAQFGDIVADLITAHDRDLVFAVFGGIHRSTHYLWDTSQLDKGRVDSNDLRIIEGALEDCYAAMDAAVGRIADAIPDNARLFIFALHGMGPNHGWYEYLQGMVERVHSDESGQEDIKRSMLYRIRKAIPWQWSRQVTMRIPYRWNRALIPLWSKRMYDWSTTRYFVLPMDYNGYIRLNIRGREARGCLDPADIDAEIAQLERGLKSFRDIKTGKPVIKGIERVENILNGPAPARDRLPDLVVTWAIDFPVSESCGVVSDIHGEIRWPEGKKLFSGRSGNHTPNGWFMAKGPGIDPGSASRKYDSMDIVPTVLNWMGAASHAGYRGQVMEELRSD